MKCYVMLSYVLFHTNVCKGTKLEVFSMRSRLQSWHIEAVATSQAKLWQRRMVSSGPCVCVCVEQSQQCRSSCRISQAIPVRLTGFVTNQRCWNHSQHGGCLWRTLSILMATNGMSMATISSRDVGSLAMPQAWCPTDAAPIPRMPRGAATAVPTTCKGTPGDGGIL